MEKIKHRIKKLIAIIKKPEMEILPGHLAFFLVLSIVPIILLFVAITSQFSISIDLLTDFVNYVLPKDVGTLLVPFINGEGLGFNTIFLTIIGLFIASNGLYSVIVAANTLYGDQRSRYIKRRIKSIILTIFLMVLFIFMIIVMAFGDNIMLMIKHAMDVDLIYEYIYMFYILIKWPFAFIYIFIIISLIYTIAPDHKVKSRSVFMGSIFTTMCWILTTYAYSFYLANFAHYDIIYGGLSSIVAMMIWVYLLSYFFIIGMAINVSKTIEYPNIKEEL